MKILRLRRQHLRIGFALAATSLLACSGGSGGSGGDAGPDANVADVQPDVVIDPNNCISPTTPNDDVGVGGYCSPGGGQCAASGPAGAPRICTADLPGAETHLWYCTYPCTQPSDCGSAASCLATSQGTICVPAACAANVVEAGVDASVDAASDASDDAAADAPSDAASE